MVVSHHGMMGHSQCWWHWVSIARVLPGKGRARASTLPGAALCHKRKLVAPQVPGQGHTCRDLTDAGEWFSSILLGQRRVKVVMGGTGWHPPPRPIMLQHS